MTDEYDCIHISGPSCFFKKHLVTEQKFVKGVFSGEYTIFINNILLIKPIIGFIKEAIYYYRRRADSSSAVQTQSKKVDFYFSQIKYVGQYLLDESKKLYNKVLPFIQFYISYNVLFRIMSPAFKFLNNSDYIEYCKIIQNLLEIIEDKYILEQKFTNSKIKLFALSKKYNKDVRFDAYFENSSIIYSGYIMINLKKENNIIIWRFLEIKENILHLEGKDNFWMPKENYFYFCKVGNKTYFPRFYEYSGYDFYTMFGRADKGNIVVFDIPIKQTKELNIQFFLSFKSNNIERFPSLGFYTHIPPVKNGYYSTEKYIIKLINKKFVIYNYDRNFEMLLEKQYCNYLKKLEKEQIIILREKRIKYRDFQTTNKKKQIWILNDKMDKARDNGEYFFRYLINKNNNGIEVYFAIKKETIDYERLKKLEYILDIDSQEYLYMFLNADKIISSSSESWVSNPFFNNNIYIRDLLHFELIFLQNGIIKDDLSQSMHRINKNFSLFITSSKKEYNYILSPQFGYNENNIVLTGLSRYDNLIELSQIIKKEKIILIIPTRRTFIRGTIDLITHESIYSGNFKNTSFYNFYNNLINNPKLFLAMREFNYIGILCLPHFFSKQIIDFRTNKLFEVKESCDYQELLVKSSLFITDYSSLFFDFGYLNKPVIYTQFDIEEYRRYNPKGYFDYEKEGFGPVCNDIECAVNEIINKITDNCKLKRQYARKIKKFFAFSDKNNNDRIYYEITKKSINNQQKSIKMKILFFFFFIIIIKSKININHLLINDHISFSLSFHYNCISEINKI